MGVWHTPADTGTSARSAQSGEGVCKRPRGCVGDVEGIMNGGATTVFLPNFVGFPSLRGLHSSTVQPRRTPRRVERAPERPPGADSRRAPRPPSRRSAAPAAAASAPAGRPSAARRAASAGGVPAAAGVVATVVPAGVAARGRPTVPGPPAARTGRGSPAADPGPATRPPADPAPAARADQGPHESDRDHRQDDAEEHVSTESAEHGVTLLPIPPKRPPVGASCGA